MKALCLNKYGGYEELMLTDVPDPGYGGDEILVQVHATAVTPKEVGWFPTLNTRDGKPRPFPIILGHEFSGVVAKVGPSVGGLKPGEAVYGMNDWFVNGAQAEFCAASAEAVARKPATLGHTQSASVPISALTAWQGLFDRGGLVAGQSVLIHGGSGGVGLFAVQLAHWRGARVIATASGDHLDFVRGLGADQVINYRAERFEKMPHQVDLIFDGVGGETLERSWSVLKPGGKLVTIASENATAKEQRVRDAFFIVVPNHSQLAEIANLVDSGKIRAFAGAVYPLAEAKNAYARAAQGNMRGKAVLEVKAN